MNYELFSMGLVSDGAKTSWLKRKEVEVEVLEENDEDCILT